MDENYKIYDHVQGIKDLNEKLIEQSRSKRKISRRPLRMLRQFILIKVRL